MFNRKSELTEFIYFCEDNYYCSKAAKKKEEEAKEEEEINAEKTRDFFMNLYKGF